MRLNDILDESVLSELTFNQVGTGKNNTRVKPQNILSRVKTGLQQFHPLNANVRNRAAGIAQSGKLANQYMADYQKWLGTKGLEDSTKENLLTWLKQKRFPMTARLQAEFDKITAVPAGQPTTNTPPPERKDPTMEQVGSETVINNDQVSAIISTAVASRSEQAVDTGADTPTAGPTTSPAEEPMTFGGEKIKPGHPFYDKAKAAATGQPSPTSTPALSVSAVTQYYNNLDAKGREELRQQLDMIDSAPAPETADNSGTVRQEGFSRYLGMTL